MAAFLAEIEEYLDGPLWQYFDLIAGTSTGGIIALCLAMGEPASRLVDLFQNHGIEIFTRREPVPVVAPLRAAQWGIDKLGQKYGFDCDMLRQSKYDGVALKDALQEVFGNRTMEDAVTRALIPSVDLIRGETVVFKTPHQPGFIGHRKYRAVDVALATSAAPLYFPHATIGAGSAYVDGGVWANNPSMVAFVEAIKMAGQPDQPAFTAQDIQMLSVGTGTMKLFAEPPDTGAGAGWWSGALLDLVSISQAQGTVFEMECLMGDRYSRIDFDIPDRGWRLDSVARIDRLFHLGRQTARDLKAGIHSRFFSAPARPFRNDNKINREDAKGAKKDNVSG